MFSMIVVSAILFLTSCLVLLKISYDVKKLAVKVDNIQIEAFVAFNEDQLNKFSERNNFKQARIYTNPKTRKKSIIFSCENGERPDEVYDDVNLLKFIK